MDSRKKAKPGENTFRNTDTPAKNSRKLKTDKIAKNNTPKRKVTPTAPALSKPVSYHVPSPNLKYTPPNPVKAPKRKLTQHHTKISPIDRFYLFPTTKQLFTTAEAGEIFDVSAATVRKAIKDEYIFAYREGLYWQIPRQEIERMIIQKYWN